MSLVATGTTGAKQVSGAASVTTGTTVAVPLDVQLANAKAELFERVRKASQNYLGSYLTLALVGTLKRSDMKLVKGEYYWTYDRTKETVKSWMPISAGEAITNFVCDKAESLMRGIFGQKRSDLQVDYDIILSIVQRTLPLNESMRDLTLYAHNGLVLLNQTYNHDPDINPWLIRKQKELTDCIALIGIEVANEGAGKAAEPPKEEGGPANAKRDAEQAAKPVERDVRKKKDVSVGTELEMRDFSVGTDDLLIIEMIMRRVWKQSDIEEMVRRLKDINELKSDDVDGFYAVIKAKQILILQEVGEVVSEVFKIRLEVSA